MSLTEKEVREIAEDVLSEAHEDCATIYDVQEEIENAVADHFANGGDGVTWEEYCALLQRVDDLEKEIRDQNFWKADRNHSHSVLERHWAEICKLWKAVAGIAEE